MSWPLVSLSGVRVSLQVTTMHPILLGAWCLCSWAVGLLIRAILDRNYFQTASGFSFAAGVPLAICSSRMVATSASVTFEYQVLSG